MANSKPSSWASETIEFVTAYAWLVEIGCILVGACILYFLLNKAAKMALPHLQKSRLIWDEALVASIRKPLNYFILALAIFHSLRIAMEHIKTVYLHLAIASLETLIFVALFIWFSMRLVHNIEKDFIRIRIEQGKSIDRTSVHAISQVVRISILALSSIVAMQALGFSVSTVLTFGGAGALAVALAARELLGNLFGGFMIYLDRPFSVGDWIRSPDKDIEGTVERIGWRLTSIRTFDNRPLYIPNGIFSSISIQNPSRMTNRRIAATIGVRYCDAPKVKDIVEGCEQMLRNHEEIDSNQTLFVNFCDFGESALNFQVYCFTKTTNWVKFMQVQQDVYLRIIEIVRSHGAECAFPTRTVHVEKEIP